MLEDLLIRDLGVIDEASLSLAPGLNVLTGETGAGKTMVVSALELLLGGRADSDRIRAGARRALVEARFHPAPASAADWLADGDDDLVLVREVHVEEAGVRSKARVGGRMAPVSVLGEVLEGVVDIHGQSDTARLATPGVQRELLDRSGGAGLAKAREGYATAYRRWQVAEQELVALQADERERVRERDRLRFELSEIDAVAPQAGEDETLEAELRRLEHAEALRDAAAEASEAILAEGAARDLLGRCVAALRVAAGVDEELDALQRRAEAVAVDAQDVALELTSYRDAVALDPLRLEELRTRQGALTALTRKYGPGLDAVLTYAADARAALGALEGGAERIAELATAVPMLRKELDAAAATLRSEREAAGARLAAVVEEHLADLAMAGARMVVEVTPADPRPHGADRVTFLLAPNAGEPALAVGRAASGGERSRVALALRLALSDADDTPVLVFDEIDAGIGGGTALAVGRKLADLARGDAAAGRPARQVLCVTHLAQLAAFADAHFVVRKQERDARTAALVQPLDEESRVRELARMLSGTGSAAAAQHAAELRALAQA